MGTNAPVKKEFDIPITEPYKPPLRLPSPAIPHTVFDPATEPLPVRQPVPVQPRRKEQQDE